MTTARRMLRSATAVVAVLLAGCTMTPAGGGSSSSSASGEHVCSDRKLTTVTPGILTVATFDPAYAPWFVGNDPGNGQGYESALAFRIGQQLGFAPADVRWKRVPFDQIVGAGAKPFDLALAEVSITPERSKNIDFSTSYATVAQAVITYEGSPIAGKKTVADLASARLGASAQTTSLSTIASQVRPTTPAVSYPGISAAAEALSTKQIDGIVADLPTATHLADGVLDKGVVLGRLPGQEQPVGAVLAKGSPLTSCTDKALDKLRERGLLDQLQTQWLPERGAVPTLDRAS